MRTNQLSHILNKDQNSSCAVLKTMLLKVVHGRAFYSKQVIELLRLPICCSLCRCGIAFFELYDDRPAWNKLQSSCLLPLASGTLTRLAQKQGTHFLLQIRRRFLPTTSFSLFSRFRFKNYHHYSN